MFQFQQCIHLPMFAGFNRFAMWPSSNAVSYSIFFHPFIHTIFFQGCSVYNLLSKNPFPNQATDCKGILLPFHPEFTYAAYPAEDSSCDVTVSVFSSMPDFLTGYTQALDVSSRKVEYLSLFCTLIVNFSDL